MPESRMTLDADGAIRSLRTVVYEKGADFVYPGDRLEDQCLNFKDGEASCIVGHVLALLGLTYERAVELGIAGSTDSWGEALEYAEERFSRITAPVVE